MEMTPETTIPGNRREPMVNRRDQHPEPMAVMPGFQHPAGNASRNAQPSKKTKQHVIDKQRVIKKTILQTLNDEPTNEEFCVLATKRDFVTQNKRLDLLTMFAERAMKEKTQHEKEHGKACRSFRNAAKTSCRTNLKKESPETSDPGSNYPHPAQTINKIVVRRLIFSESPYSTLSIAAKIPPTFS